MATKSKKIVAGIGPVGVVALTAIPAYAQEIWGGRSLKRMVDLLIGIIGGALIPIAITALFLTFVISVIRFIRATNTGEDDLSGMAKKRLLYPILILGAIFTLWGAVALIRLLFQSG